MCLRAFVKVPVGQRLHSGDIQARAGSVIAAMIITLVTVTFVGEAVREAFDPKLHTTYE